jgi:shikimate kinase
MTKNVVLIGLMGSGKTTVGKLLAQDLDKDFIDTDELIENQLQKSINDVFQLDGEQYFRKVESEIIKKVSLTTNKVISTGGGSVENVDNLDNLKGNGIVFYLKTSPEELFNRIKNDTNRPLLKNDDPLDILKKLLAKREEFYNLADFIIDTSGKQICEIVNEIKENYKNNE